MKAKSILIVLACVAGAVLGYELFNYRTFVVPALGNPFFGIMYLGIPVLILAGLLALVRLPEKLQANALLSVISTLAALYALEFGIALIRTVSGSEFVYDMRTARNAAAARKEGKPFDKRKVIEVITEFRDSGAEAFPFISRQRVNIDGKPIQVFGGIARKQTVLCNECGSYMVYRSDENGFNNPSGLYTRKADIVILGDSYAQGDCVAQDSSTAAFLRRRFPNTLTLGAGGMAPLMELAVMKEYCPSLAPAAVIWFYYEGNDLEGLVSEKENGILMRYLGEKNFNQGLTALRPRLDAVLESNAELAIREEQNTQVRRKRALSIINLIKLHNVRAFVTMRTDAINSRLGHRTASGRGELELFRRIIVEAKATAESWGGKFYFVYIPEWERFATGRGNSCRADVLKAVSELDIPVIDLFDGLRLSGDPLRFYPFRMSNHFNEAGYEEIARIIAGRIDADHVFPN